MKNTDDPFCQIRKGVWCVYSCHIYIISEKRLGVGTENAKGLGKFLSILTWVSTSLWPVK